MMNFGQLSTIYHGIKQQEGETAATATREVIVRPHSVRLPTK